MKTAFLVMAFVLALALFYYMTYVPEAFGVSPGTFEQLQSTHVPAYKIVYM